MIAIERQKIVSIEQKILFLACESHPPAAIGPNRFSRKPGCLNRPVSQQGVIKRHPDPSVPGR